MVRTKIIVSFCILFVTLIAYSECSSVPDLEKLKKIFDNLKDKFDSLKDSDILKKVVTYGKVIGHSAAAVKDIVSLIQSFMGGPEESKELEFMREQFAIINTKMDAMEYDFIDIKNQIDWSVIKVNIGNYERSIKALEKQLKTYFNAPPAAAEIFSNIFVNDFERGYNDAAAKVYIAVANEGTIFQENILHVARRQLKNHKGKLAKFVGYVLRLIHRGVTLETAYLNIKKMEGEQAALHQKWAEKFKALEPLAAKVDQKVRDAWKTQYAVDVDEFAVRNAHLDNRNMATNLFFFLKEKYPWRYWFVFVYTFTNNNDKDRYYLNCDGVSKVNAGNKVVIVNGNTPGSAHLKSDPKIFFRRIYRYETGFGAYAQLAKVLYERSPTDCKMFYFKGVFESKSNPSYWSSGKHFFSVKTNLLRSFHGSYKEYEKFVLL